MADAPPLISGWERVARAVEVIRRRLLRATAALNAANVPYAVVGGHAVAEWVGRVDQGAVRNTKDVDILLRRADLPAAAAAMAAAGFVHAEVSGVDMFLDGPNAGPREAVHVIFAGERVREQDVAAAPDVNDSEPTVDAFRVIRLDALVRMKLTAFRLKDRLHVQDMLEVGLIDGTWPDRLPPPLGDRLRQILADPDG